MDVVLGFINSPMGAPSAIGVLAVGVAFVAVFPLRGGNGQHAGAGPVRSASGRYATPRSRRPRDIRQKRASGTPSTT